MTAQIYQLIYQRMKTHFYCNISSSAQHCIGRKKVNTENWWWRWLFDLSTSRLPASYHTVMLSLASSYHQAIKITHSVHQYRDYTSNRYVTLILTMELQRYGHKLFFSDMVPDNLANAAKVSLLKTVKSVVLHHTVCVSCTTHNAHPSQTVKF